VSPTSDLDDAENRNFFGTRNSDFLSSNPYHGGVDVRIIFKLVVEKLEMFADLLLCPEFRDSLVLQTVTVNTAQATPCHISKDSNFHRCDNLKSDMLTIFRVPAK
jgi:hypothetical protein